jgi:uncharacterized protein YcfL
MTLKSQIFGGILVFVLGFGLGYFAGQSRQPSATSAEPALKNQSSPKELGPWKAVFRLPRSVEMPEPEPILRCLFEKSSKVESLLNPLVVTVSNLESKSYMVHYEVYGYDAKGRRVSEGVDEFAIGPKETVVRRPHLESQAALTETDFKSRFGSTFGLEMALRE